MTRALLLVFIIISTSYTAFASENLVAILKNDIDQDTTQLIIESDAETGEIVKFHKDTLSPGKPKQRESYTADSFKKGIVLERREGYDIVKVNGITFNCDNGGDIAIDYLTNAITKSREIEEVVVSKEGDHWSLFDKESFTKIRSMFLESKKIVGKTVGIKKIHMNALPKKS